MNEKFATYFLIAPGFDERRAIFCLSKMRAASLSTTLVGLRPGLISSYHGLQVRPDLYIGDMRPHPSAWQNSLILITGDENCQAQILSDPRSLRLVTASLQMGGCIATLTNAIHPILKNAAEALKRGSQIIARDFQPIGHFSQALINRVIAANSP